MATMESPWLTASAADGYAHVRKGTMMRLCRSGAIPSYRVGRATRVHKDDVDAWMRSQQTGMAPMAAALSACLTR